MTSSYATLADLYAARQAEMERLHDGEQLRQVARAVLGQLPDGPLFLISTSAQGAALAAVCAATRQPPTQWRFVNPLMPAISSELPVVVIEPLDAGAGWRDALLRRYPKAKFVFAEEPLALAA